MNEAEIQRMVVRMVGDASSYTKMAKDSVRATNDIGKSVEHNINKVKVFGDTIDHLGTQMSGFAGSMRALTALESPLQVVRDAVKLAGESEMSRVNLGTLLGDDTKGADLVKQLQRFAADTPLAMRDLEAASKTLLQANVPLDQLQDTLRKLGDAAMGDKEKFKGLAVAFAQMRGTGRTTNEELNQMRERGFSPLNELAKVTGIAVGNLKDEIAKGKVTFAQFEKALIMATSAGGKFDNGMLKASKTLDGLFSTMQDDLDSAKRIVGEFITEEYKLRDVIKAVSAAAQEFGKWFNDLDPNVKRIIVLTTVLAASFGSLVVMWRVGSLATGILVGNMKDMVVTFRWLMTLLRPTTVLMGAFNAVCILTTTTLRVLRTVVATVFGPWGLALMAVTVLVSALIERAGGMEAVFNSAADTATRAWHSVAGAATGAWDWMKAKGLAFWGWFKPYWDAAQALALRAWDYISAAGGRAWDWITERATTAWTKATAQINKFLDFVSPIFKALESLGLATWDALSGKAAKAWTWVEEQAAFVWQVMTVLGDNLLNFFSEVWKGMGGIGELTWTDLRDLVTSSIYLMEFAVVNFDRVWALAMQGALLETYKLISQVEYFFQTVIPVVLVWFGRNWKNVFSDLISNSVRAFGTLVQNMVDTFSNIDDILTGKKSLADFWKPLDTNFQNTVDGLVIPDRVPDQIEQTLQTAFDAAQAALTGDWWKFLEGKMSAPIPGIPPREFLPDATVQQVQQRAQQVGDTVARVMVKPAEKFDAALYKSSEAIFRVQAFRDANRANPENRGRDFQSEAARKAEADRLMKQQLKETQLMRRALEQANNRPQFSIMPADFNV